MRRLLHVHFLARVLAHVADEQPPGAAIEAISIRIAQPVTENLLLRPGHIHERIVRRDGSLPGGRVNMNAQDFAQQRL